MNSITIKVRRGSCDTYIARTNGGNITASCTSSPERAAEACARKVFLGSKFTLRKEPDNKPFNGHDYGTYIATPK